jgi:hypothetical protein
MAIPRLVLNNIGQVRRKTGENGNATEKKFNSRDERGRPEQIYFIYFSNY